MVGTLSLDEKVPTMAKSRIPYPAEFRQQMVELGRSGRSPGALAKELEPSDQTIYTWTDRIIGQKKGTVRLLPVIERGRRLFGEQGSQAVASWLEQEAATGTRPLQGVLFPDWQEGAATPTPCGR